MVVQEDGTAQVPIEDIETIIIDNPRVSLTAPLLRAISMTGATLVVCDEKHLPCGLYLSQYQHFKSGPIVALQSAIKEPHAKRIWQSIVIAKIKNQAQLLLNVCPTSTAAKSLLAYPQKVKSGDTGNVESIAARIYWSSIFNRPFQRGDDRNEMNKALNFGYAIVRSGLARAVISRGLLPLFGIHHRNMLNAFCLVDDLIEPFRPFVDAEVAEYFDTDNDVGNFDSQCRYRLIEVLHLQVRCNGTEMTLASAMTECASSFVRSLRSKKAEDLIFPVMVPIKMG